MARPTEAPAGLLAVPYGKGCLLLLTPQEIAAGIRRGKWWKRRQAMLARQAGGAGACGPSPANSSG